MKHTDLQHPPSVPADGRTIPAKVPISVADQDGHARTHALLTSLARRVESLELGQAAHPSSEPHQPKDRVSQMLNGKMVALFNLTGSTTTLLPYLMSLIGVLAGLSPIIPRVFSSLPGLLFPFGILTATSLAIVAAGRWIKRKSRRIKFLAWIMGGYSLATAAYLLWLSAGFLRFNTLPSGVLLATCGFGVISILRNILPDIREMWARAEVEAEKEW